MRIATNTPGVQISLPHQTRRYAYFAIVVAWHIAVILENVTSLELETRASVNRFKMLAPLALLIPLFVGTLLEKRGLPDHIKGIWIASLAFPVFYLGSLFVREEIDPLVLGFQFAWPMVAFLALPMLVESVADWRRLIRWNVWAGTAVILYYVVEGLGNEDLGRFILYSGRLKASPGFINPNLYATELAFIVFGALILFLTTKRWRCRALWALISIAGLSGIYFSASRSTSLFICLSLLSVILLQYRKIFLLCGLIPGFFLAIFIYAANQQVDYDDIASGRFTLWTEYLREWLSKATLDDILLGDQIQQIMVSHRYNPLIVEGGMESHRFYTDNTYLNWILEFGLIGAVLFLIPIGMLVVRALRHIRTDRDPRLAAVGVAGMIGIFGQGFFTTTIPTFANSTALLFLTILVPAMFLSLVKQEQKTKLNMQAEVQGQEMPVRSSPPLRDPSVPVPQGFSARTR